MFHQPSTLPVIAPQSPAAPPARLGGPTNAVRPAGLTDAQRQTASNASRALRLAADRLDEARLAGRVDLAREALQVFGAAGVRVQQLQELLK